jgi:hypothetical protein
MYQGISDLANKTPARETENLPDPAAYRFGAVDVDRIFRKDPEHTRWLYHSPRRPLGAWLDLPHEHTLIGGDQRSGTVGTSAPLPLSALDGAELVPVDASTRAASVLYEIGGAEPEPPKLSTVVRAEDGRGAEEVRLLLHVPEHDGARSLVRFKPEVGPVGHQCFALSDPYSFRTDSLLTAVQSLLRGEQARWLSPSFADRLISDWVDEADLSAALA